MELEELLFLVAGPRLLVDGGVEVVVPPLPALLAGALGNVVGVFELLSDLGPVVESKLRHQLRNGLVFLNRSRCYLKGP